MADILLELLDWSEVWGLFIPIAVLIRYGSRHPPYLMPVVVYVFIALFINIMIDVSWKFKVPYDFPYWLRTNNYMYNTHSVVRFFLFSLFFIRLDQPWKGVKKIIALLFLLFVLVNFIFFEDFFNYKLFSSRLLTTEAAIIFFYCILYYYLRVQEEELLPAKRRPDFWIVVGLSFYFLLNYFIYLFYKTLNYQLEEFAITIWNIHNITFVIFCIFIAKGFYDSSRR